MDQLIQKCPSRPQCHLLDIPYLPLHGWKELAAAEMQNSTERDLGKYQIPSFALGSEFPHTYNGPMYCILKGELSIRRCEVVDKGTPE